MIFSSHELLPRTEARFKSIGIPLVLAVTPVPRDLSELPLVEFPAPKCTHCGAFATPNYLRTTLSSEWRCSVCYSLNTFKKSESGFHESAQSKVMCYDGRIRKDGVLESVNMNSFRVVFAVERSNRTIQSGLFKAVIAQARSAAKTVECPVAFVVFDKNVHLPLISNDRKRFCITTLADDDYRAVPALSRVLFSMPEDGALFESYLAFLEKSSEAVQEVLMPLDSLVDCMGPLIVNDSTVLVYSSESPFGTFEKLETIFEPKSMSVHFRILKDTLNIANSQPLSRFAIATNSSVEVIDYTEIPYIPTREIPARAMRVLINACISNHFLKLKEIHGRGRISSPHMYTMTSASYNDTVYFTIECQRDLQRAPLPIESITVQFQVRCFDKCGLCVFRIMNIAIPITESFDDLMRGVNMDVVMAANTVKSIIEKKETPSPAWLKFVSANAAMRMQRSIAVFNKPGFIVPLVETRLLGSTPFDVACYMAPTAYKLELGSQNAVGPHLLSSISNGALLVNYSSTMCLLYLHESEDLSRWMADLESGAAGTVVAKLCRGRTVFIVLHESSGYLKHFIQCHICS